MNEGTLSKGLFLTVATILVTTGVAKIGVELWTGVGLMLLGAGVFVLREYLKKQGYSVSGK